MIFQWNRAFTLVELIVVITVLAVLWTIAYISLLGYSNSARDTVRISDLKNISKLIELYKVEEWVFPDVSNPISVSYSGEDIWQQWSFWEDTRLATKRISEVPKDPLTWSEYVYSKTNSTWEYQVWGIVEKYSSISYWSFNIYSSAYASTENLPSFTTTLIKWNYNGKFIANIQWPNLYILWVPSILANESVSTSLENIYINESFIYEWGPAAPITYSWSVAPGWIWNFRPTNVSWDIHVVYSWSISEFNTETEKINFIWNLKDYYVGTDVISDIDYTDLLTLDIWVHPNRAVELANTYINSSVWGLNIDLFDIK